jgi:hypothetical protein
MQNDPEFETFWEQGAKTCHNGKFYTTKLSQVQNYLKYIIKLLSGYMYKVDKEHKWVLL